jgi:ParB-like chromosome segregation protein Spo0J
LSALYEMGQQVPVVVVAGATVDHYVLIDGYLRVELLRRLGLDTVDATVWPLSEADALITHFHLGGHARSTLEEAWLIEHLAKAEGLSQDELGRRLCRSKSWVSRRLGLRKLLPTEIQTRVAAGQIPPQAAMKYLLPLARANPEDLRQMVAGLGQVRISVRQMGKLVTAYRTADPVGRTRLCQAPLLYLQMEAQAARATPAQATGVERLVSDLGAIAGLCGRARRRARAEISAEEFGVAQDRIWAASDAARGAFATLCQELAIRLNHDRPGPTHGDFHPAGQGPGDPRDSEGAGAVTQHGARDPT